MMPNPEKKDIIIWIHVYPNWKTNFNSNNGNKRSFSYETNASISFILSRRMCLWCPILKRKTLLFESMFIPIERRTSILIMVIREVFLMKPTHQYHLSYRGECVYDAQSWKERHYYLNPCLSQLKDELQF